MSASRHVARPQPAAPLPGDGSDPHRGHGPWLTPLRRHWTRAACALLQRHAAVVRVTVAALAGSAPREPGATLLVHAHGIEGTIGGGRLEWLAVRAAHELLRGDAAQPAVRLADWTLGPQLGQCCGGRVTLWLERLARADGDWLACLQADNLLSTTLRNGALERRVLAARSDGRGVTLERHADEDVSLHEEIEPPRPPLWLFGAGHVGQALVRLLAGIDAFEVTWIDSRADILPRDPPGGIAAYADAEPAELVQHAAAGTCYLVMTHDHGLDYEICRAVLERGDAAWLGLIGSASKAARFRSRLLRDGVCATALRTLTCPIGIAGIAGKQPAAIAIAIAADLLQRLGAADPAHGTADHPTAAHTPPAAAAKAAANAAAPADACAAGCRATCGTRTP